MTTLCRYSVAVYVGLMLAGAIDGRDAQVNEATADLTAPSVSHGFGIENFGALDALSEPICFPQVSPTYGLGERMAAVGH